MSLRDSFAVVSARRAGTVKAGKLMGFAVCWASTHAKLGRIPTVEEYADDWATSRATAYREQARWREYWPEFATPSDLYLAAGYDLATLHDAPAPHALDVSGLAAGGA